mgnify:CR=1 FL=1
MKEFGPNTIQNWLAALPFWSDGALRRAFIDDFLWQIGVDAGHCIDAAPMAAAAQVAMLCDQPLRSGRGTVSELLRSSLLDRGLVVGESPLPIGGSASFNEAPVPLEASLDACCPAMPYPGLRPFRRDDAPLFFGRGLETRTLLRMLADDRRARLVIVAGPSGSGKTSLVQAGLLAALARGGVPGLEAAEHWPVALIAPSDEVADPATLLADALAASRADGLGSAEAIAIALRANASALPGQLEAGLAGRPGAARWLLCVDGLEQVLLDANGARRLAWLDLLGQALMLPRVRILATLRADFLAECIELPLLRAALDGGGLLTLPTPTSAHLAWMLRAPLDLIKGAKPDALNPAAIQTLVSEALAQPAPLLHLAARARGVYCKALQSGSCNNAAPRSFDDWCDQALAEAEDADAQVLPRVLSRLVRVDETRAPLGRCERLDYWKADPAASRVIHALSQAQQPLLRIEQGAVPRVWLAHDGLPRAWRRLAVWVEQRREAQRLRSRLGVDIAAWEAAGCPDQLRWPDELLRPARALLAATDLLAPLEHELLAADFLTPEAERLLTEILCSRTDDASREDIGLRLARIGDPRPGVLAADGCPLPRWCDVPGGVVIIDGRREAQVRPFRLAAYPVTLAQFDAFVRAEDGFADERWWSGLEHRPLEGWNAERRGNYPATQLSWYDATAFCRWLGDRLGLDVRLPDESEWQWAAQSARADFVYPWGCDWLPGRANTDEAGIGRTTAVGMYPAGRSLQGSCDLAGNIWEWCHSTFDVSGQQRIGAAVGGAAAERGARVIRGGSWRVNRGFARADFRLDAMPGDRVGSTGFRVACSV